MSFVEVLPVEPVIATTRADERSRTAPAIAASAAVQSCGTSVAAAPRASACSTKSTPPSIATNRSPSSISLESTCSPVTSRPRAARPVARAARRRQLERDHAVAPVRRSASRATSRSSNGTVAPAISISGSSPLPAITRRRRARPLRSPPESQRGGRRSPRARRPRPLPRSRPDPRARVVGRHDRAVGERPRHAPISGRFSRSRSPPAPNTTSSRPSPSPRAAARTFASESGVWA